MSMFYGAAPIIFKNARRLRHNMTLAENLLWSLLCKNQIYNYRFRRQHPLSHYVADFYCHRAKLIIELDGGIHNRPDQALYDATRTEELESLGLRVLRFKNYQIMNDIEAVIQTIKKHLNNPPLKGSWWVTQIVNDNKHL